MLSGVVLLTLTFVLLGLLLSFASSFDAPRGVELDQSSVLPADVNARDPKIQNKLFEDCIKDQRSDGELTEDEYFRCAYNIYD